MLGDRLSRVMPQAGKETNKQASKQANDWATRRRGRMRMSWWERGVERNGRDLRRWKVWSQRWEKCSRAKNGSGPEAAKWLPLQGLGGRWQVAGGQGRTSAVLAVAGRVWAPDFYRVAGRTGRRNTMRLGAVTVASQRHTPLLEDDDQALFSMSYILTLYARSGCARLAVS